MPPPVDHRQLFQRLLRERIIFLGQQVDDDIANRICAQLLLLAAEDDKRDICLYINSPGGSVNAGLAIYDTMQFVRTTSPPSRWAWPPRWASSCSPPAPGQALRPAARADPDAPAVRRHRRYGLRHPDPGRADALHEEHAGRAHRVHTGQTVEQIESDSDRDRWFTAEQAKEYGFVDHVVRSATRGRRREGRCPEPRSRRSPRSRTCERQAAAREHIQPGGLAAEPRYILPSFVERTPYGIKEMNPYTKLFEERIIFLGVQIDDASANDVMAQLLWLESMDPDRDILIYINSPGGSFTALTAIYDTMQYIRPEIQTVCLGQAASAAAVLLAAGTKGKRLALPNSRILIHQPATEAATARPATWRSRPTRSCGCARAMETIIAKHTGQTRSRSARHRARQDPHRRSRPWSTASSTRF